MKSLLLAICFCACSVALYYYVIYPITTPQLQSPDYYNKKWEGSVNWEEEDLMWFIQVSDLHISYFHYHDSKEDLDEFFSTTLDTIKPKVVIASGDLTDAKSQDGIDSYQLAEEWTFYANTLNKHNVLNKTIYLDIRGNHDSFDVPGYNHKNNLYRLMSARGGPNPTSYIYKLNNSGITYSFVALDATPDPGPKKVFNFLGHVTDLQYSMLEELGREARSSDRQIWFGHYPTSCIVAPKPGVRKLMEGGLVYLSGHLHTLGGLVPTMYSLHQTGTLELELADWKENRKYRLVAVDHGLLSFADISHGEWPVIVVTNPKNSAIVAPEVEPVSAIMTSSHVRILAFSPHGISQVMVQFDDEDDWKECEQSKTNPDLFIFAWEPHRYSQESSHSLKVFVTDYYGYTKTLVQPFHGLNSDLERPLFSLESRILLMSDVISVLKFMWILALVLAVLPVSVARYLNGMSGMPVRGNLYRLMLFANHPILYNTFVLMGLYLGLGPWYVGGLLQGHLGVVFPWGTYVAGVLLPSFYPYIFSVFHIFFFHLPLLFALMIKLDTRVHEQEKTTKSMAMSNVPITLVLSLQAYLLIFLYMYPSKLGIFKEIALLIAPVEIASIAVGFSLNALVSHIIEKKRQANKA